MHLLSNDKMHEQFSIMRNVFPNCFGFALLCLMIGLENLRPHINQLDARMRSRLCRSRFAGPQTVCL